VRIGANAGPTPRRDDEKQFMSVLPFVAGPGRMVGTLVKVLAGMRRNVNGLSKLASEIIGKRLEIFKESVPGASASLGWSPPLGMWAGRLHSNDPGRS